MLPLVELIEADRSAGHLPRQADCCSNPVYTIINDYSRLFTIIADYLQLLRIIYDYWRLSTIIDD